jgi:acetyl esterase
VVDISKLDPNIKAFLDVLNAPAVPTKPENVHASLNHDAHDTETPAEHGRHIYLNFALAHAGWPLTMPRVEDLMIPSSDAGVNIPIRIYTPELNKKLPVLIFYHGGGWQRGDIASHDSICRHFARYSGAIVVSVEWRLAPEHKFPTGPNDCLAAYKWVAQHGNDYNMDTSRIGISGDSAGGNMTAITAQRLRKENVVQPIFQLMLYPSLDLSCSAQSYVDYADGFFLTTERVKFYVNNYVRSADDIPLPECSPLKQQDLSKLPPAHIVTNGFDPLKDEGQAYAKRLQEAGIPTTHKCYEAFIHAFLHMNDTAPAVEVALQEISGEIKKHLFK